MFECVHVFFVSVYGCAGLLLCRGFGPYISFGMVCLVTVLLVRVLPAVPIVVLVFMSNGFPV